MSDCEKDLKQVAKAIQPHFPVGAAVCIQSSDYVVELEATLTELEQQLSTLREALNEAMGWNWLDAGMNEEVSNRLAALLKQEVKGE